MSLVLNIKTGERVIIGEDDARDIRVKLASINETKSGLQASLLISAPEGARMHTVNEREAITAGLATIKFVGEAPRNPRYVHRDSLGDTSYVFSFDAPKDVPINAKRCPH